MTGSFTSFDGGATWIDGQIPMRSGNGAGDPAAAFDRRHGVVLMAQLENAGGLGSANITQADVSVSRSTDGGGDPERAGHRIQGPRGHLLRLLRQGVDDGRQQPSSPFYGRAYVTVTRFLSGQQGAYEESPIWLSWSDDGGRTWTKPKVVSGSHSSCSYQGTGGGTDCDEDQFPSPR